MTEAAPNLTVVEPAAIGSRIRAATAALKSRTANGTHESVRFDEKADGAKVHIDRSPDGNLDCYVWTAGTPLLVSDAKKARAIGQVLLAFADGLEN